MPAPITLGAMKTSVLRRANIENLVLDANSVITNPEIREYINEGLSELYDLLIAARAQEWYRKSYVFTTQSNQASYPLPADMYQLLSVDIFLAPNIVLTAQPYEEPERNRFRWYPGWFYSMPVYYRLQGSPQSTGATLQGSSINFIPSPTTTSQVSLNYYPAFTPFATDGSADSFVFDGVQGWEQYAVWYAAALCLEKIEQNSDFCQAQVAKYRARIEELASDHDAGHAPRVHDIAADWDPWSQV